MRLQVSEAEVNYLLTIEMKSLKDSVADCLKNAKETEMTFEKVWGKITVCGIEQFQYYYDRCCVILGLPVIVN